MNLEAFYKMSYGIYMIASCDGDELSAYIANTAFQVTATPPKLAISCHKDNHSAGVIERSGVFTVSALEKDTDAGLIGLFGYKSGNEKQKFQRVNYITGVTGAPVILTHAAAYFECRVVDQFDVGTHYLFIGEVVEAVLNGEDKDPLTYAWYREELQGYAPERAPTYIDRSKIAKPAEDREAPETTDERYICPICAYVYDPLKGDVSQDIPPGTPFEDLPADWICPVCAAAKSMFIPEN
ncbi:MAG: flavin reductase [Bacteroidales bacterium]|nr:flavin reductase [Bacteroidales bacterium]